MGQRRGGSPQTGWSALRPVLVAFLLVADAFAVATLVILRPGGWFPPFLTFAMVLVGLIWFEIWAIGHRRDDG
jgi:K+ transporter